ncbi:hypothetical protein [uncultured Pseudodesulfovibrio sp.]|uniref:hypothetical protein n=1 Tax=uncultured Pseudodesulfovibrio sp. TaxID=2035858 RepID=UPI0029C7B85B|nr:hypothetical protein [uncultured Pseudodesulfovibrio sp.]
MLPETVSGSQRADLETSGPDAKQHTPGFRPGMKTGEKDPKTGEKSITWTLDRVFRDAIFDLFSKEIQKGIQ